MKSTKYLSITVLVLLSLLLTTFSLAYWVGSIETPDANNNQNGNLNTVQIGTGKDVTTSIDVTGENSSTGVTLVPVGHENETENELSEVVFTYSVEWKEDLPKALGVTGNLEVAKRLLFDKTDTLAPDLFTVDVQESHAIKLNGDPVEVSVTVTFAKEPENKIQYDEVIEKLLNLELTFKVTETTN